MKDIQVSIVASAARVQAWDRFYNSLKGNSYNWEVIFVGPVPPLNDMPENFRWIKATAKPAQCYEIGFRAAKGELIHWSADDADYVKSRTPNGIDVAYDYYKMHKDYKFIVAMRPFEDGGDVWSFHHFFGGAPQTPTMAPFGLMSKQFLTELGGYDKHFISGQSENDLVMRGLEAGGRVGVCMDATLWVHHGSTHAKVNIFRKYYTWDRQVLENAWLPSGYGSYTDKNQNWNPAFISKTRLKPVEPFIEQDDWLTVSQGEKGDW